MNVLSEKYLPSLLQIPLYRSFIILINGLWICVYESFCKDQMSNVVELKLERREANWLKQGAKECIYESYAFFKQKSKTRNCMNLQKDVYLWNEWWFSSKNNHIKWKSRHFWYKKFCSKYVILTLKFCWIFMKSLTFLKILKLSKN